MSRWHHAVQVGSVTDIFITVNSAGDDLQQARNLVKKFEDSVGRVQPFALRPPQLPRK